MEYKEFEQELQKLHDGLEAKSAEQIKTELKTFKESYDEFVETKAEKIVGERLDVLKTTMDAEYKEAIKVVQDHADALELKLAEKKSMGLEGTQDPIKELITKNFDAIAGVRKGNAIKLETKVVGNMTLANLTGDAPRSYSNIVAMVPSQLLNVADLCAAVNITGGTYTYPRETTSEGSIGAPSGEGLTKPQIDYDLSMIDASTDFIAGFAVYSKKMANNLPYLESFLPNALRRDYWKAENAAFEAILAAAATASTETSAVNKIQMLINDLAKLEELNYNPNTFTVRPSDFYDILTTEVSDGAGYGLPGVVTFEGGVMRINGIPLFKATWLPDNTYYVGDYSYVKKVITQGLGVEFSTEDSTNFRDNNITARVEAQVTLTVERPDALTVGDFTAV